MVKKNTCDATSFQMNFLLLFLERCCKGRKRDTVFKSDKAQILLRKSKNKNKSHFQ